MEGAEFVSTDLASVTYPYTTNEPDRHGNDRWYVRIVVNGKNRRRRIRSQLGTPEWVAEYERHLRVLKEGAQPRLKRVQKFSLEWLINHYIASAELAEGSPATKLQRRNILYRIAKEHGHRDCRTLSKESVEAGRNARAHTPGAANNYLKSIKAMYRWGMEKGHVRHNPAEGVKRVKMKASTWKPWTAEQREQFKKAHPYGTTARTAFHLAFDAGLRRSDVVRIGPGHRGETHLRINQQKTGKPVAIMITDELAKALDTSPAKGLTYVESQHGRPFSVKSFGAAMRRWVKEAGLPKGLSLHGLRKADGVRMAEAGATENEIAAKLGHSDTRSASIYTKGADQQRLADAAIRRYSEQTASLLDPVRQNPKNNSLESGTYSRSGGPGGT